MDQRTDEEIVSQVQKGEIDSFGVLVERYEAKMMRYGRKFLFNREDIADLVQDIFIKAYVNIQGFNIERKFSLWLYRIAHNEFINAIKKKKREPLPFFNPDTLFPHPITQEAADYSIREKDFKNTLNFCLDKVDPKYREPLVLYYFEEMGYQEIAEILHVPVSTVGVRLWRGRIALRKIYNELNPQHG